MVVAFNPLTDTGCSGVFGRIGIGIVGSWLALLGRPLVTNPGQVTPPVVVVIPLLDGTRAATVIRSLMFPSLVPSSRSVSPGFHPCSCCSMAVVLAPSLSEGPLLWSESEL